MSRTTIRNAAQAYLTGSAVTGLAVVHKSKPRNWSMADFRDAVNLTTASGYIYVEQANERREANGKRSIHYVVSLQLLFRTRHTDVDTFTAEMDTMLDAIKTRLRSKPAGGGGLGVAPSVVFEAAEHLLEDATDLPVDGAALQDTRAFVRFDVSEWLNA